MANITDIIECAAAAVNLGSTGFTTYKAAESIQNGDYLAATMWSAATAAEGALGFLWLNRIEHRRRTEEANTNA